MDCQWTPWSAWGFCSASCGAGTLFLLFPLISLFLPFTLSFLSFHIVVPFSYLSYTPFISYALPSGTQTRTRSSLPEQNGGQPCTGGASQSQACQAAPCPTAVNCQWSAWTQFGPCSVTCGIGAYNRTRYGAPLTFLSLFFTFIMFF
jgi:hemicentin